MAKQSQFSEREFLRYARHLQLPQFGAAGQIKLKQACVTIVGCGGLGAPASIYLAASGVGHIRLIDDDNIELSNLQRQINFGEKDLNKKKADVTRERLLAINSDIKVSAIVEKVDAENVDALLAGSDIVLDCSDNFSARYTINASCKRSKRPWLYASIFQFSAQLALFKPNGPCYRCLFPKPAEQAQDCSAAGVIGVLPGIAGSLQALQAIKYLALETDEQAACELMLFESMNMEWRKIAIRQDPTCLTCRGKPELDESLGEPLQNRQRPPEKNNVIDAAELETLLEAGTSILLVDVRSTVEHNAYNLGGINIPLQELDANSDAFTDNAYLTVFYCQSGIRSAEAVSWAMNYLKIENARSLNGGITSYLARKD